MTRDFFNASSSVRINIASLHKEKGEVFESINTENVFQHVASTNTAGGCSWMNKDILPSFQSGLYCALKYKGIGIGIFSRFSTGFKQRALDFSNN